MIRRLVAVAVGSFAAAAATSPALAQGSLLAPPGVCPGQGATAATPAAHTNAMHCLVNYARARVGAPPVRPNAWLRNKALAKVRRVQSCQEFSHTPCGVRNTLAGSGLSRLGEVIYAGRTAEGGTPRATMAAWLASAPHRRSLLNPSYRAMGVGHVGQATLYGSPAWIWAANLGA